MELEISLKCKMDLDTLMAHLIRSSDNSSISAENKDKPDGNYSVCFCVSGADISEAIKASIINNFSYADDLDIDVEILFSTGNSVMFMVNTVFPFDTGDFDDDEDALPYIVCDLINEFEGEVQGMKLCGVEKNIIVCHKPYSMTLCVCPLDSSFERAISILADNEAIVTSVKLGNPMDIPPHKGVFYVIIEACVEQ